MPIPRHRAVRWLDRAFPRMANAVTLAVIASLGLLSAAPSVASLWTSALQLVVAYTAPDVQFGAVGSTFLTAGFAEIRGTAGSPTPSQWLNTTAVTAILVLLTALLPRRLLPLAYLLRFAGAVQLSACVFFLLVPALYPYGAGSHATTILHCGWATMLLAPWLLALCYYPLDHGLARRVALTVALELFLVITTPLLAAWHLTLLESGSLLMHPLLYLVFGPPAFVFWFVCFYGWGMSWRDARRTHRA